MKHTKGFTLVELLMTIAVIAIIATISAVAYRGVRESAHDSAAVATLNQAAKAIKIHALKNKSIPILTYSDVFYEQAQ